MEAWIVKMLANEVTAKLFVAGLFIVGATLAVLTIKILERTVLYIPSETSG